MNMIANYKGASQAIFEAGKQKHVYHALVTLQDDFMREKGAWVHHSMLPHDYFATLFSYYATDEFFASDTIKCACNMDKKFTKAGTWLANDVPLFVGVGNIGISQKVYVGFLHPRDGLVVVTGGHWSPEDKELYFPKWFALLSGEYNNQIPF